MVALMYAFYQIHDFSKGPHHLNDTSSVESKKQAIHICYYKSKVLLI